MSGSLRLESPILIERLRRAREDRGLSQDEAASRLGVARTTLVAIEAGERRLRAEELLALASIYEEPLDALLREDPAPRHLAAQFRTAAGKLPEHADLRAAASELQHLSEDYFELERIVKAPLSARYPDPVTTSGDPDRSGRVLAEDQRLRLNLGDGPLPHLREVLENEASMRIFAIPLPSRIGGLFGFDAELGACVAMNAKQPWERQRWSLAHEYAHFLTRRDRPEITVVLSEYRRVPSSERFADAFARHFLLPAEGVRRRWELAVTDAGGDATAGLLLQQADWWGVSFQAFALRLEGLKLVRPGTFESFASRGFAVEEGRALLGLPAREADDRLLPRRYRLLALSAFADGLLSEERLARFLRADRVSARALVAASANGPEDA
jgi:Zn-dependent peptidase ImmA (M78 family)/DNA-binding XRE family transcriptional regulator